jgi:hypothetical protein
MIRDFRGFATSKLAPVPIRSCSHKQIGPPPQKPKRFSIRGLTRSEKHFLSLTLHGLRLSQEGGRQYAAS